MWKPGDRLTHRFNPEMGPGQVVEVRGRNVVVRFPESDQTLSLATGSDALVPLVLVPGARARLEGTNETVVVSSCEEGLCRLEDGREVPVSELWPLPAELPPAERLARGQVDSYDDFLNRVDGLRLQRIRQAGGLGSFLGGRIQLFPHQLYAAERACHSDPVRWLLADEVGLGKTVEACLILNRLLQTGRADRTLIVAPETLTLQWLGELWRKYHQVFVLLDEKRLADVARDHGADFNPFDVHRRVIVGLDTLASRRRLTEQAAEAGIDLLVVDEAHHLRRPPGHPGSEAYRAVAPIAALGRHVLLLSATPLEDDAHGFFRLLQLLRPEEFPEEESFADRLARREPLPPCTSSARRADIGGLPPRVGVPVDIEDSGWEPLRRLERLMRSLPADNPLAERRKAERIVRALSSPAAVAAVLDRTEREDPALTFLLPEAERADPRVKWLAEQAARWQQAGEKTLVFVAHRETLERLKAAVEREGRARAGLFHEDLPAERRDIEVAQFRLPEGPAILISTEAGGEGRTFEFCRRLILFDLPWNPAVVEQRIGRLDRIGRKIPTEIVYFRPPSGLGRAVAGLYEAIGLFEEPLGGMERELRHVARAVEREALQGSDEVDSAVFEAVLKEAQEAHDRVRNAAYHELHRDPYRPEMAGEILARVPPDLDFLNESVVLRAAGRFGFLLEPQSGRGAWAIEFGWEALVDHIPGVPPGSRYLGTFDRAEAVDRETLDFFASGHPLVEGVLWELEDGPRGQVALFQVSGPEEAFGLLAIYRRGVDFEVVAVDSQGRPRPDLAERLTARDVVTEPVEAKKWTGQAGWGKVVRRMAAALPGDKPQAMAAFRIRRTG
ncbi:MAG: SNF2-related protein [Acidobacteriota bacterium]